MGELGVNGVSGRKWEYGEIGVNAVYWEDMGVSRGKLVLVGEVELVGGNGS